jgi:glycosyltransferase involved in cell wall biosynthesis
MLTDVVVPARDHGASLAAVLAALPHRQLRSVVVVDRGSTDGTSEIARAAGALVLREPGGGYGAACLRAIAHLQALPRPPDAVVFVPGDEVAAAGAVATLLTPIAERGAELVVGTDGGRPLLRERMVTRLIDTVYRHRWSGVGPVRALRFPALVALGMSDRDGGWDVEMLVRAVKLGLTCDEVPLPAGPAPRPRVGARALLHILRHSTMR